MMQQRPHRRIPFIYEIIVVLIIVLMFGCLTLWGIVTTPRPTTTP